MRFLKKGDKVCFKGLGAYFGSRTCAYNTQRELAPEEIFIVFKIGDNNSVFLDGFGEMFFNADSLELICPNCLKIWVDPRENSTICHNCSILHRLDVEERLALC